MDVYREGNRFCIEAQDIYASFPDTEANRKTVVVLLRWLRQGREGHPLFTHQELALILKSDNRQAASEHAEQFRACGEDFEAFIRRKRKVDEAVVEAVFSELTCDPLCSCEVLGRRVQTRLGRTDLREANIRAAFEQIPYGRLRPTLKRLLEQGQAGLAYREQALIEDLLSHFEAEDAPKAGLSMPFETPDRVLADPTSMRKLIQPGAGLDLVCAPLQWVCWCFILYYWGIPLSRLGQWMGVHKTTVWRWIIGLVVQLDDPICQQIHRRIEPGIVYVDEKWLKIKGVWHYWFVVLDAATHIPIYTYLASTRSGNVCAWIGMHLYRFKDRLKAIVTDGLSSYASLLPDLPHLLCHFHHQQGVTTWVNKHLSDSPRLDFLKTRMKRLLQTRDKRTVARRMDKLKENAQAWGIVGWVKNTQAHLEQLLPAVGSRVLPTTTNAIERFFRHFGRFYKNRNGFHCVDTAKDQLALFLIGDLFSKRAKDGTAPIETIWPEAALTPLYQIFNDPFSLMTHLESVKQSPKMADPLPGSLLVA